MGVKIYNPQDMTLVGNKTQHAVIYKNESHKLHQAFTVKAGETIVQGMPVALSKDGLIPYKDGVDDGVIYIGIAMTDSQFPAYPGEEVTVAVKGFAIVYGVSEGELAMGDGVVPTGELDETGTYVKYKKAEILADHFILAVLNSTSGADELIQVLVC